MNRHERRTLAARLASPTKAAATVNRSARPGHRPGAHPDDTNKIEMEVTRRAMLRLQARAADPAYGDPIEGVNELSEDHEQALLSLIGRYSALATRRPGYEARWAYPIVTGGFKSMSVACWIGAVSEMNLGWSTLISASRISELLKMRRRLLDEGVDPATIAVWYSDTSAEKDEIKDHRDFVERTEPDANGTFAQYQHLLVSHSHVHGVKDAERLNAYTGRSPYTKSVDGTRDLVVWDEACFLSHPWSLLLKDVYEDYRTIKARLDGDPIVTDLLRDAITYLDKTVAALQDAKGTQHVEGIPAITAEVRDSYAGSLKSLKKRAPRIVKGREGMVNSLITLIENSQLPLRVVRGISQGDAAIRYDLILPSAFKRAAVLDASFPIRALKSLDSTIQLDPSFHGEFKDYSPVKLHIWNRTSGEAAMRQDFNRPQDERIVSRAVAELFESGKIADQDSVLIFCHKNGGGIEGIAEGPEPLTLRESAARKAIKERLRDDLIAAGVAMETPDGKPRVFIDTLGRHDSTNDYSHVRHVILAGFLFKPMRVLAAHATGEASGGEQDKLDFEITQQGLDTIQLGEVATIAHQAGSRGRCRYSKKVPGTTGSRALAMDLWCLYDQPEALIEELNVVMPGIDSSEPWVPSHTLESVRAERAKVIVDRTQVAVDYLEELEASFITAGTKQDRQLEAEVYGGADGVLFKIALRDLYPVLVKRAPELWQVAKDTRITAIEIAIELRRQKNAESNGGGWRREGRSLVYSTATMKVSTS